MTINTSTFRSLSRTLTIDDFKKYIKDRETLAKDLMNLASMTDHYIKNKKSETISGGVLSVLGGLSSTLAVAATAAVFPAFTCTITALYAASGATGLGITKILKSSIDKVSSHKKKNAIEETLQDIQRLQPIIAEIDSRINKILSSNPSFSKDLEDLHKDSQSNLILDIFTLKNESEKGLIYVQIISSENYNDIDNTICGGLPFFGIEEGSELAGAFAGVLGLFAVCTGLYSIHKGLNHSDNSIENMINSMKLIGTKISEETDVIKKHEEALRENINSDLVLSRIMVLLLVTICCWYISLMYMKVVLSN